MKFTVTYNKPEFNTAYPSLYEDLKPNVKPLICSFDLTCAVQNGQDNYLLVDKYIQSADFYINAAVEHLLKEKGEQTRAKDLVGIILSGLDMVDEVSITNFSLTNGKQAVKLLASETKAGLDMSKIKPMQVNEEDLMPNNSFNW